MTPSRNILLLTFMFLLTTMARSQEAAVTDSIRRSLARTTNPADRVYLLDELSRVLMNVNPREAEEAGKQLIAEAEESRDRKLMFRAYIGNGIRCSYLSGQKTYAGRAIEYFEKALELARQNRMEKEVGSAQMYLSGIYLTVPDKEKALSYATQAFSLVSTLSDDSLKAEALNTLGQVYRAKNEKILALRNFFNALHIAEDINNQPLIKNCYVNLYIFYASIEAYDKAIDNLSDAYHVMDKIKEKNVPYQKTIFTTYLGNLYAGKKNYDMAISYYERSIRMADSLRFSTLKVPAYVGILNQYLRMDEPDKALAYLNSAPGRELKVYLSNFGMGSVIDQAFGVIYTELGRYDSARFYLEKARPMFENSTNEGQKISFYSQLALFYRKSGNNASAIEYYLKVKEMSEKNGMLESIRNASRQLDTLYTQTGDLALAGKFKGIYYLYKDSIETLKREKELTQVEADDEQQRLIKKEKEAQEQKRRRNNIQYMSIVIGIVVLFMTLVVLGMFKVSAGLIKAIGFFVFLLLFEFIFLVFKKNIYSITHGEPLKDLAFMIALAALLVPLHHWLEHRVLHYLTSHNRLTAAGHHIRNKLLKRTKGAGQSGGSA